MYVIDKDIVVQLDDVPQHDPGASEPVLFADGGRVVLAYFVANSAQGQIACLKFSHCWAHYFGGPNDETLQGHPLHSRGLKHYSIAEVKHSSWIQTLATINSVHAQHRAERFQRLRHFIFAFHDSMFECAAEGFEVSLDSGGHTTTLDGLLEILRLK
jgi:hypothetical protein